MLETTTATPWLTVDGAASRLCVSKPQIYRAVRNGELRAARIGGRRNLRFLAEWVDAYAVSTAAIVELNPRAVR